MKAFLITLGLVIVYSTLPGQTNKTFTDGSPHLKSVRESKVTLDSVIITREPPHPREKIHYLYTPEGYNTKCVHYYFIDSTNKWEQTVIDSCTYDSNGKLTSWFIDVGKYNGDKMR